MSSILRRINRLINKIKPLATQMVTLFYRDGSQKVMQLDSNGVIDDITSGRVIDLQYHDRSDSGCNFYEALISAFRDHPDLLDEDDDSWMLEGVE